MGLERLQAGEREGTQAALLCGVVHTFFITIIKNSPKNTACTTHCVVHWSVEKVAERHFFEFSHFL